MYLKCLVHDTKHTGIVRSCWVVVGDQKDCCFNENNVEFGDCVRMKADAQVCFDNKLRLRTPG